MSIQPVLGPYQFATADEDLNCGCGGEYCTPFISGDLIAFQIPSVYSCCKEIAGCGTLDEECVDEQNLTSDLTFTQGSVNISFDHAAFVAGDWILKGSTLLADNTKFMICFCLRGHIDNTTVKAMIGTTESDLEVMGNGDFCLTVDPAFGAPTLADWGIIVTGGDDSFTAVLECLSICEYRSYSAAITDSEGGFVADLSRTEGATGNQIFEFALSIPAEVAAGCYTVKLTDNCGAVNYYSQCLSFLASVPCTGLNATIQFKWRNRNDAFGYDYTTDDTYYNYVRVTGRLKHPTFPDDTEIYTTSANTNDVINARVQKLWKVALSNLPEYVHNAIATMRRHSDFQIDGLPYVVADGAYAPEWRKSSELANSEFEAFDQDFPGISNSC